MFHSNVLLSAHSNYKIGGQAGYFFESGNFARLSKAIEKGKKQKLPIFILGGGTNILFSDFGYSGLILKPTIKRMKIENDSIVVGSGVTVADLLNAAADRGLSGLEWAGGLPGTVGGAIRGNAGAFGGEINDNLKEVISLDFFGRSLKINRRFSKECRFGYRDSIFKSGGHAGKEVILSATFEFKRGDKKDIKEAIQSRIDWRQSRQPLNYPNIGSIFKNFPWQNFPLKLRNNKDLKDHLKIDPFPVIPAAYLIDQAGLKGVVKGGAMISPRHPNFIVNVLDASSADVLDLIGLVKSEVLNKFKISLEEEVLIIN